MRALWGCTALAAVTLLGCASPEQRQLDAQWQNRQAPDFELTALDGQKVKLSDYRGMPVVLAFWAHG